jgi:hypothetical protein
VGGGAGVEEAPEGPEGLEGLEGLEGPDEGSEGRSAFNARLDHWAATPAMLRLADASMPLAAKRALASALEADDPEMRVRAIALLREQPEEHAISGLERLLNDPTEAVKIAVIRALAQFGRAEHALAFAGLVGDPARMVRFAAADALRLLPDGTRLLHVLARSSDVGAAEAATLALWQENAPTHDGPIGDRLHLVSAAPGS